MQQLEHKQAELSCVFEHDHLYANTSQCRGLLKHDFGLPLGPGAPFTTPK